MEAYNDQMKGEIAVTRRATYKAEESISQLEGGKRAQVWGAESRAGQGPGGREAGREGLGLGWG